MKIKLSYPDVATDELGNAGQWTMIYNQVSREAEW